MTEPIDTNGIVINTPPEYEMKLLTALSYFLGRKVSSQALACLCMYLRQSEPRIMSQVRYYAHKLKLNEYDLLDLIYSHPERVNELLSALEKVHSDNLPDVFERSDDELSR